MSGDYFRDFRKQFEAQNEADKQTIKRAEEIYLKWEAKEFTLNTKANKEGIVVTVYRRYTNWMGQDKTREVKRSMTVADLWINALFEYTKSRGSPYYWKDVAAELKFAYDSAHGKDCLGGSTADEMEKLRNEISDLTARLGVSNKNADKFEKRFKKTNDALIEVHNKLTEYEKELSDMRGHDIKSSFDNNTSGVLQGKFGDEGDDDKK